MGLWFRSQPSLSEPRAGLRGASWFSHSGSASRSSLGPRSMLVLRCLRKGAEYRQVEHRLRFRLTLGVRIGDRVWGKSRRRESVRQTLTSRVTARFTVTCLLGCAQSVLWLRGVPWSALELRFLRVEIRVAHVRFLLLGYG